MIIERFFLGVLETNCYLVGCTDTHEAMVIDPGGEPSPVLSRIEALSLTLRWIIDTHGHMDHMAGNAEMKRIFPEAQLAVHEADKENLERPDLNLSAAFGIPMTSPTEDVLLRDGDEVACGNVKFEVIHVPGHTPGGIALFTPGAGNAQEAVLFCGDALFAGGIGRTDFPGGSHAQLIKAVRERLLTLPSETTVYPGHGEPTTIQREATSNPFLV